MWREWSQLCPEKYNENDQRTTWRGFKGITGGTIIKLARDHGYAGNTNGQTSRSAAKGHAARTNDARHHAAASKLPTAWSKVEAELSAAGYELKTVYCYFDESGFLIGEKVRFEHPKPEPNHRRKTFRWRHETASGELLATKRSGSALPPYGLLGLLEHADQIVFGVEGEKDVDRLNGHELVAISVEQGHEDEAAKYLAGRDLIILPDNDEQGRKRARALVETVRGQTASARILELLGARLLYAGESARKGSGGGEMGG
jgi:hypothetical protein